MPTSSKYFSGSKIPQVNNVPTFTIELSDFVINKLIKFVTLYIICCYGISLSYMTTGMFRLE